MFYVWRYKTGTARIISRRFSENFASRFSASPGAARLTTEPAVFIIAEIDEGDRAKGSSLSMRWIKARAALILLASCLAVTALWLPNRPRASLGPLRRLDREGVPLPAGALLRVGSTHLRHAGNVCCITYAPDGKLLGSGGRDNLVRLWEPHTGAEVSPARRPYRRGHIPRLLSRWRPPGLRQSRWHRPAVARRFGPVAPKGSNIRHPSADILR